MDPTWLKQDKEKPLFPDILWQRPENKQSAGKLLIIGGNVHSFNDAALAYSESITAGIGTVRVVLPDALYKSLSKIFPEALFAPSTKSGSFAKDALGTLLNEASWADGVLIAGDLGKNSETEILIESFMEHYKRSLTVSGDGVFMFTKTSSQALNENLIIVSHFLELQKIARNLYPKIIIKHDMNLNDLVNNLSQWTKEQNITIATYFNEQAIIAKDGKVSTTKVDKKIWEQKASAYISVWSLQQPGKIFEATTSAISQL